MNILRILVLALSAGAASLFLGATPAAAHDDGFVGVQVGPIGLGLDVDDDWDDYGCGGYDRCGDRCDDDCWWGHHWRNYYYDDCRDSCDGGYRGSHWDDGWAHRHHRYHHRFYGPHRDVYHRHYHHRQYGYYNRDDCD
jgi:hypothetical protein